MNSLPFTMKRNLSEFKNVKKIAIDGPWREKEIYNKARKFV